MSSTTPAELDSANRIAALVFGYRDGETGVTQEILRRQRAQAMREALAGHDYERADDLSEGIL